MNNFAQPDSSTSPQPARWPVMFRVFPKLVLAVGLWAYAQAGQVPLFSVYEISLSAADRPANPYVEVSAEATLVAPDGRRSVKLPLFWDGGVTWRFRFSPDQTGIWNWSVRSSDSGLSGKTGKFEVIPSTLDGSIRPRPKYPHHFERQSGKPFWFLGDTAWALFTDNTQEQHNHGAARAYIAARAAQGFNVLHSMLLSEAGWGNAGGPPFHDLAREKLNADYWREVDKRVAYINENKMVVGLALAWGDKRRVEPYAWRRFPGAEARERYARYIAARYSAFDVYFLVSGEWHAEIKNRPGSTAATVKREFIAVGDALRAADPHGRMIGIHPMTSHGSVREFNAASWMSFGDYQQNYRELHERILISRKYRKPVVNSEYGYFLRDLDGDGIPDKDNSTSLDAMRHASWDIAMAGGYLVTGFGTTYFGGNRDPGPFDLSATQNRPWEKQIGLLKNFFTSMEWWKLEPHDELIRCGTPRGREALEHKRTVPPPVTYWCLAELDRQYVLYVRGVTDVVELDLSKTDVVLHVSHWDPRTAELTRMPPLERKKVFRYRPPDTRDWLVVLMKP